MRSLRSFQRAFILPLCRFLVYRAQLYCLSIMAPLSLLGTVVRDKMMKTVTVQVILLSRELRADAPCFFCSLGCSRLRIFIELLKEYFSICCACSMAMTAECRCYELLCIHCTSARRYHHDCCCCQSPDHKHRLLYRASCTFHAF